MPTAEGDGPTDDELRAWGELQAAMSDDYHARLAATLDALAVAEVRRTGCDVCAAMLDMVPRDVADFLAALDRVGPILGQERVTVGGIWTFSRAAYLWHESQHGT